MKKIILLGIKFNGSYNGIYINIPFDYEDKELEEVVQNNKINDNLYNGKSKIITNSHASFKVKNVKPGQYVAARVLFNNDNIPNATKLSNISCLMDMTFIMHKQVHL